MVESGREPDLGLEAPGGIGFASQAVEHEHSPLTSGARLRVLIPWPLCYVVPFVGRCVLCRRLASRCLKGTEAPLRTELLKWLSEHPDMEVRYRCLTILAVGSSAVALQVYLAGVSVLRCSLPELNRVVEQVRGDGSRADRGPSITSSPPSAVGSPCTARGCRWVSSYTARASGRISIEGSTTGGSQTMLDLNVLPP